MIWNRITPKFAARLVGGIALLFIIGNSIMQSQSQAKKGNLRVVYMPGVSGCQVFTPSGKALDPLTSILPDGAILTGQCLRTVDAGESQ
ncbi:hypothetical protein DBB29_00750 [Pandoraea cepalis]|uniref:Uncharacterized protein n=2 Tax=Pandoraea cepalis TaxID=2508294 RepID=A0AAW7MGY7_9BURK|nr:hypothetical protein [Pandoraea cepalis]MDN4576662.1 hypothetical protein [Pandoraea cepalis]